uniref:MJ1255/VC2487 family glycosyltransferase n=1 Tax=Ningiella ruwaisensis TaxID=2364274 RepID=UPI00109F08CC|nr:MJ1255/VC2487 family glycosyltransferase [Ningiella ruwaisensis]
MKILYGVQGTGNGHITRARHMAHALAKRSDLQVDYLFSGRASNNYFDMEVFNGYQSRRGLTFITENGRINRCKTLTQNNVYQFITEFRSLVLDNYDLVINDFEPVSAWAAKLSGVPSLSVSHQAAFLQNVPKHKQGLTDKIITKHFAPTQYSLGTHWYHFGHQIIPPFVTDVTHAAEASKKPSVTTLSGNPFTLVYLPFETLTTIQEQLQIPSEQAFICYHPDISKQVKDKNILWCPLSTSTFKQDLHRCAGVIANSGFELSTECLTLGKALLLKPLKGQYEQLSNAYTLKKLDLCEVMHSVNAEEIDEWLQHRKGTRISYPGDCQKFVDWIAQGNWHKHQQICKTLWEQVKFPDAVKAKLATLHA